MRCSRCHYTTTKKSSYSDHLRRKFECPCTYSNEDREQLLLRLESSVDGPCACTRCNRTFSASQYLDKHKKACVGKMDMEEMRQLLAKQAEQLRELLNVRASSNSSSSSSSSSSSNGASISINNNINNNTNINISININNFGSEDRSYITRDVLQSCLENMHVSPLVDLVYFNPDHPENHTVKLKSEKKGRLVVRQEGTWIEVDMNASIDSMIHKENNHLHRYFYEQVWPDPSINYDSKAYVQSKLIKINDADKRYYDERRSIQAKLKNAQVTREARLRDATSADVST